MSYQFVPASSLLTNKPQKIERITTEASAKELIKKLELTEPQLEALVDALELSKGAGKITDTTKLNEVLCEALVKNEVIVCVETPNSATKSSEYGGSEAAPNTKFDDSPHPEAVSNSDNSAVDGVEGKNVNLTYPVETEPNEAFFWSGRTNGHGGESIAKKIAEENNGTTLEVLVDKRNIEMPKWDPTNPDVVKAWKNISADYAKGSSGTVRAVIGKDLRPGNVWETSELPALKNNPNVTKIITIDPVTNVETEIFTRGIQ